MGGVYTTDSGLTVGISSCPRISQILIAWCLGAAEANCFMARITSAGTWAGAPTKPVAGSVARSTRCTTCPAAALGL